ncbi:Uncharacterised protein [Vibrio cholerae]|uniref:Uncharacterized protein n=1 Tax=Vibrio cholerae TaxID=666 RepID=A0A655RG18_VIBCL|nr:Uncharacterised protein [Vibrio cholerae]
MAVMEESMVSIKCHQLSIPISSNWVLNTNMKGKIAVRIS